MLKVALAQLNPTIGAFDTNLEAIDRAVRDAADRGAQLVVTPELSLVGYPPRDLMERRAALHQAVRTLEERAATWPAGVTVCVGTPAFHDGPGTGVYNAVSVFRDGTLLSQIHKRLLPTYDVFDDARHFDAGGRPALVEVAGIRLGICICEDGWNDATFWPRRRYAIDPVQELVDAGAQCIVNLSASPFGVGKSTLRRRMLSYVARRHGVPVVYCNASGGDDGVIFDGQSLVFDARGHCVHAAPQFRTALDVVTLSAAHLRVTESAPLSIESPSEPGLDLSADDLDELFDALVLGIRDYVHKTGFRTALVGLSGGIDSALVAVAAVSALGPQNVSTVALPSRYTAAMSNDDAAELARKLECRHRLIPIEGAFAAHLEALAPSFAGKPPGLAEENLQSRIRGTLLMALSNKEGSLLLTTGNKSELATGYCTLYGDMNGALAVIGDLYKTQVYALCRRINVRSGGLIPERILTRAPSAELREGQTDQDSLPPYDVLDRILRCFIEGRLGVSETVARIGTVERTTVQRVARLFGTSEYKRYQAAPVLRLTDRALGVGWTYPLAAVRSVTD